MLFDQHPEDIPKNLGFLDSCFLSLDDAGEELVASKDPSVMVELLIPQVSPERDIDAYLFLGLTAGGFLDPLARLDFAAGELVMPVLDLIEEEHLSFAFDEAPGEVDGCRG